MKQLSSSWLALFLLVLSPPVALSLVPDYGVLSSPGRRSFLPTRTLGRTMFSSKRSSGRVFGRGAGSATRTRATMRMLNPASFKGSDMTITDYPMPVLRRRGVDVVDFDDGLRKTCKEMISIMYQADGVGLAAPQVNLGIRLFVYNHLGDPKKPNLERIVINPKIVEYSRETTIEEEACLSSRSGRCGGMVCRSVAISVEYLDEEGRQVRRRIKDFEARVFQHEYDHIEGVLHLDRFCSDDRTKIQSELDRMVGDYEENDGILDITKEVLEGLQPPPLRPGCMPPLGWGSMEEEDEPRPAQKKEPVQKSGFGGFGGGGGKNKKGKGKKKK